jgi:hypothetical protein
MSRMELEVFTVLAVPQIRKGRTELIIFVPWC